MLIHRSRENKDIIHVYHGVAFGGLGESGLDVSVRGWDEAGGVHDGEVGENCADAGGCSGWEWEVCFSFLGRERVTGVCGLVLLVLPLGCHIERLTLV